MSTDITEHFADLNRLLTDMRAEQFKAPDYVEIMVKNAVAEQDIAAAMIRFMQQRLGYHNQLLSYAVSELMSTFEGAMAVKDYEVDSTNYELCTAQEKIKELEAKTALPFKTHPISDPTVRDAVWSLTQGKCAYCDVEIKRDGQAEMKGGTFCVEHVVPASSGGPDNLANYVPACMSCNSSKGDRHVLMLLRRMQRRPDLVVVASNEKAVS